MKTKPKMEWTSGEKSAFFLAGKKSELESLKTQCGGNSLDYNQIKCLCKQFIRSKLYY